MIPDNGLISNGYCLRDTDRSAICYSEQPNNIQFDLDKISMPAQVVAVDTRSAYREIEVSLFDSSYDWQPPYTSDWAFHITGRSNSESALSHLP